MSVLKVLHYPDKRLRKIAHPVKIINVEVHHIIKNMLDTMYQKEGIGLAATQVNIHKRIIVIDISESRTENWVFINPVILNKYGNNSIEEGCLSILKYRSFVPRAKIIKLKALDIKGNKLILNADNLFAICIQHEIDHLDGRLFIDYLS